MADIMHFIKIKAAPERVYQAISTSEGIRKWWTRDADLDGAVGGTGEFRFLNYGPGFVTRVRIDELTRPTRAVWSVLESFRQEWGGTTISFDLSADGSGTILLFAHRGFVEADDRYAQTTTGWAYYLVSLQQFLETGAGAPSPDIDFARVIRR
jgi:uncharacterized protein YndB with AHSA1/START domain